VYNTRYGTSLDADSVNADPPTPTEYANGIMHPKQPSSVERTALHPTVDRLHAAKPADT